MKVTPKAAQNRIGETVADADGAMVLKFSVTAAPDRGKANAAVIRQLSKAWGVPKTSIKVNAGVTSRCKTLQVEGDAGELDSRLRNWVGVHNG